MKKIIIALAAVSVLNISVGAASKSDPVLLTVNGKDITLSEFEYLYNKSNSQQQQAQPVSEYLDMFVNFKLKVADAEAAGLDTTASFRKEYDDYRHQLAEPYLVDSTAIESMLRRAYSHMLEDVSVSHVMLNGPDAPRMLDSLRNEILAGNTTFEDVALHYSIDPSAKRNMGRMGYVPAGATPYLFEDAMYEANVGEISPVVFSGLGYHIIRVDDRRPAKGEVQASHILKQTRGFSDDRKLQARNQIDSIYDLVKNGADFAEVARRESEDPGSAAQGGSLGWFGAGRMVQPFDSISFALPDGAISQPFETPFGYHIIKKTATRTVLPLDSLRNGIMRVMEQDGRVQSASVRFADSLADAYGVTPVEAIERYIMNLPAENQDYRNLLNEYRDGILLFDISNSRVWEKAASDEAALKEYFNSHRDRYTWSKPRYKGYVLYATSDSVMDAAKRVIASVGEDVSVDSLAHMLRPDFGKSIKIERVLTA
ncbi:MAG: peptidylprolyl isomerase, partial [Muribaculaceae bacterium]|nr:peptidylprolyl isomerase [Muribaculaceae bacterium]